MREAGSKIVKGVSETLLGMMSPESAMGKFVLVFNRVYSDGHCASELRAEARRPALLRRQPRVSNEPHAQLPQQRDVHPRDERAKGIDGRISRDEVVDGKLLFEVTVTYD